MIRFLPIIILCAMITPGLQLAARASALATPPSAVRMVIFNSVDGSNLTTTPITVNLGSLGQPAGSVTRSILIGNDAATDATGHSDLLINFVSGSNAATPANGVAGSTTIRIFPGKEYNFDGQFTWLSLAARLTSIPAHVFVSY